MKKMSANGNANPVVSARPREGLAIYRDRHRGQTILVCGCGSSLSTLDIPESTITIGVNDIGRKLTPDYLVVLNAKTQFKGDRFKYVENSRARAIFTQLNLGLSHPCVVRFKLGQRGGTDFSGDSRLPYTRNSPYVAVCLAAFMGAKRIGLIGVDFTDDHFFAKTGRHPLRRELGKINQEYRTLAAVLKQSGVEIYNLSRSSLIDSLPKIGADAFFSDRSAPVTAHSKPNPMREGSGMVKIQVEKHSGELIGGFFDQLARTAKALGYPVERRVTTFTPATPAVAVVWNGRRYRNQQNIIYCEHGWLPRDAYQVSPKGINADSHLAPFRWNGQALTSADSDAVRHYIDSLKSQQTFGQSFTATSARPVTDLPPAFLLVPLQLEQDTNIIRHVSPHLRRMQAVVDLISRSNPPFPVIYKQHPMDAKKGNRHLQLRVGRRQDCLRPHHRGNIHQILKTGACKGIISLNSNVVHDGFLWDVPSIVLGRNIWPDTGVSPFIKGLPDDWYSLDNFYRDAAVTACREAYIHYIMRNQWTMADARDTDKVMRLLERKICDIKHRASVSHNGGDNLVPWPRRTRRIPAKPRIATVNVVARNKGWLFEDLKAAFSKVTLPDVKVIVSDKPRTDADTWLYLRASEVTSSPNKARTLVQIHDQFDDGIYAPNGNRRAVKDCGAICFTHGEQKRILEANGIELSEKILMTLPLGAADQFALRVRLPERFTVAWVGRPVQYQGRDFKRVGWLVDALEMTAVKDKLSVALIGERLQDTQKQLLQRGIDSHYFLRTKYAHRDYPSCYQNIDCVVITSEFAAGPNCLYEALASGVPVIATRCGWTVELIQDGKNGFLADSPTDIAAAVDAMYTSRQHWFEQRGKIKATLRGYALDTWLKRNIQIAAGLLDSATLKVSKQVSMANSLSGRCRQLK